MYIKHAVELKILESRATADPVQIATSRGSRKLAIILVYLYNKSFSKCWIRYECEQRFKEGGIKSFNVKLQVTPL